MKWKAHGVLTRRLAECFQLYESRTTCAMFSIFRRGTWYFGMGVGNDDVSGVDTPAVDILNGAWLRHNPAFDFDTLILPLYPQSCLLRYPDSDSVFRLL